MLQGDGHEKFDTSAALLLLDSLLHDAERLALRSAVSAWETAWIACLTNSPRWSGLARADFALVVSELRARVRTSGFDATHWAA